MIAERKRAAKRQPGRVDAPLVHGLLDSLPCGPCGTVEIPNRVMEENPRLRNQEHRCGQGVEHPGVQFEGRLKKAECDVSIGARRELGYVRRIVRRSIHQVPAWDPQQFLAIVAFGQTRRVGPVVCDPVVHRGQARGAGISRICDLYGCGPPGKNTQPHLRQMARDVQQNIDPVSTDRLLHFAIGQVRNVSPMVEELFVTLDPAIPIPSGAVGNELDVHAVVMAQNRRQEEIDRTGGEFTAQNPQPNPALRFGGICKWLRRCGSGENSLPLPMCRKKVFAVLRRIHDRQV